MVKCHPMADPDPAVVPDDVEGLEPELGHDLDLVLGRSAFTVSDQASVGEGLAAVSVASEVRRHDREVLRQFRGDLVPLDVGLGIPVQQ
jgi:hypothetical protein